MSDDTITIKKESLWKYSTFILAALLIVVLFLYFGKETNTGVTGNVVNTGQQQLNGVQEQVEIPIKDNDLQTGSKDAKVTVVEFSDFSCPFCGGASGENKEVVTYLQSRDPSYEAAVPGLLNDYVKSGKVKFVLKYFPGHGTGQVAQVVSWCINDQNKEAVWKFHDLAFAHQDETNDPAKMKTYAQQAGADIAKLEQCISSKKHDARLSEDTNLGQAVGVSGTPQFFVNGKPVQAGAIPYSTLKQAIDAELAA